MLGGLHFSLVGSNYELKNFTGCMHGKKGADSRRTGNEIRKLPLCLLQAVLLAILAAEEAIGEALAPEGEEEVAQSNSGAHAADVLLHILNRSAALQQGSSSSGAPGGAGAGEADEEEVAYRLGLAILEPLSQLITPLLGRLQSRASDAQACCSQLLLWVTPHVFINDTVNAPPLQPAHTWLGCSRRSFSV